MQIIYFLLPVQVLSVQMPVMEPAEISEVTEVTGAMEATAMQELPDADVIQAVAVPVARQDTDLMVLRAEKVEQAVHSCWHL